jgi:hypothetical protein
VHRLRMAVLAIALTLLLLALLLSATAHADAPTSVSFTPLLTQLEVASGSSAQFTVVLRNDSPTDRLECSIYAADIMQRPDGQYGLQPAGSASHSLASMMRLSANRASVEPGGSFAVTATVTAPWGEMGGRYGAVVFEVDPDPREPGAAASTAVVQRFMSAVEVTITGRPTSKRLDIVGFAVSTAEDKPAYAMRYGRDVVVLGAEVRNSGDIHVFARGSMVLRSAEGRRLLETPIGGGRGIVLPGATVALEAVLPDGLAPGSYVADLAVSFDGSRPVTARVPFVVGQGDDDGARPPSVTAIAPLSVLPAELELSYSAGATVTRAVTVENRSGQQVSVTCSTTDVDVGNGRVAPSCRGWIKLWPEAFVLQPGARQTVQMLLAIPGGVWGGRYAELVFAADPVGADWSSESTTRIHLTVGRDQVVSGALSPVFIEAGGPTVGSIIGVAFANTGSVHVRPHAVMQLSAGSLGEWTVLHSVDQGEEQQPVLPGEVREVLVSMMKPLEPGTYRVEFRVDVGDGGEPLSAVREFSVEPQEATPRDVAPNVRKVREERGDMVD